jgi:DNA invertase Pin-like site-specific DNA recombinase
MAGSILQEEKSHSRSVRAVIYARVSTTNNGQDPSMQTRELHEYCLRRGWTAVGEYVDAGISGTKERRPRLDALMADAARRKFDIVVVWKFDRFARSVSHLLRALENFQALGIEFVSLSEQLDTSTPTGKMVFTVLGAVAELERSLIVERVRAGMRNARSKGKRIGRPPRTVLSPEVRKSIAEAYWCRKASFRQLAKRFDTSIGTVQRCALAYQKTFSTAQLTR